MLNGASQCPILLTTRLQLLPHTPDIRAAGLGPADEEKLTGASAAPSFRQALTEPQALSVCGCPEHSQCICWRSSHRNTKESGVGTHLSLGQQLRQFNTVPTIRYRQYVLSHHQSTGFWSTASFSQRHSLNTVPARPGLGWQRHLTRPDPTRGSGPFIPTLGRRQLQGWCLSQPTWHHSSHCLGLRAVNLVRAIYGISKVLEEKYFPPIPLTPASGLHCQIKLGQRAKDYKTKKLFKGQEQIAILANTSTEYS